MPTIRFVNRNIFRGPFYAFYQLMSKYVVAVCSEMYLKNCLFNFFLFVDHPNRQINMKTLDLKDRLRHNLNSCFKASRSLMSMHRRFWLLNLDILILKHIHVHVLTSDFFGYEYVTGYVIPQIV